MNPVAVVGGGITGLTAAHRLHALGVPVVLYEAGERAGGMLRSVRRAGFLSERGPNTILNTAPQVAALVGELGLAERRLGPQPGARRRYIVKNGALVPLPASLLDALTTTLFSARGKLRVLCEPFVRRAGADREETIADFVNRRLGREVLDYAVDPFVGGIYAGDPAQLSMRYSMPKLRNLEQKYGSLAAGSILGGPARKRQGMTSQASPRMFSFDEGVEVLPAALRQRLSRSLRLNTPVNGIARSEQGWLVRIRGGPAESHSAVLLAAPAHRLAAMEVECRAAADLAKFARVPYAPVARIVFGFRREQVAHPLDGFGALVPAREPFHTLGFVFNSSIFPGRAPEGHVAVTAFLGGARSPELTARPADVLQALALEDMKRLLGACGPPVFMDFELLPRAIPQYTAAHGEVNAWAGEMEQCSPGLYFAGNYRDGISTADSIVSGKKAAERIRLFLRYGPARHPVD